jgi:hypothetical protein
MDVESAPAHRTAEVESTKTMINRVESQFEIKPDRLIGDTAYGTAPMLAWMAAFDPECVKTLSSIAGAERRRLFGD